MHNGRDPYLRRELLSGALAAFLEAFDVSEPQCARRGARLDCAEALGLAGLLADLGYLDLARRWLGRHRHDCTRPACRDEAAEQLMLWEICAVITERAVEADDPAQPQWRVAVHRDLTTWVTVRAADAGTARAKALHRADYGDGDVRMYGLSWPSTERLTGADQH
ncbi:hypothetical protein [Saccharopolyspora taberi]|uniref:Uncharacterized protein n=1 Tax=Saccharopolyspora taberi TaxID=60895 RepID=A0ABN3V856_9PSEU